MSDSLTDEVLAEGLDNEPQAPLDTPDESPAEVSSASEDNQDAKEPTIDAYQAAREVLDGNSSDSDEQNQGKEAAPESDNQEDPEDDGELPDEVSDDELTAYKPKTRKRIEQLLGKNKDLSAKVESLEQPAGEYAKIEEFLRQSGTTFEQAGDALEISALMNANPEEAYKRLVPIVQELGKKVGAFLPQHLADRVKKGLISREDATTLARAEAGQRLATEQRTRLEEGQRREQFRQSVQGMEAAVRNWETGIASSDPDYETKRARVGEKIEIALSRAKAAGQIPRTAEDAVAIANRAYAAVNEELKPFIRKPAVTPVDGGAGTRATAKPRNEYEAAEQALAASAS